MWSRLGHILWSAVRFRLGEDQRSLRRRLTVITTRREHNEYQAALYVDEVEEFLSEIAPEIRAHLARIVEAAELRPSDHVLDVGTGAGILIPYISSYGVQRIVGCDLSPVMLAEALKRYPDTEFWEGDIVDLPVSEGPFDACFFNGMFGNVWDPREVLAHAVDLTTPGARLLISHPFGGEYVAGLHKKNPKRVPRALPTRRSVADLIKGLSLAASAMTDEPEFYLLVLKRTESGRCETRLPEFVATRAHALSRSNLARDVAGPDSIFLTILSQPTK